MVSGGKMGAVVPWRLRSTRIVALARLSSPTISVLRRSRVLSTRRRAARRSFCSRQLDRARAGNARVCKGGLLGEEAAFAVERSSEEGMGKVERTFDMGVLEVKALWGEGLCGIETVRG